MKKLLLITMLLLGASLASANPLLGRWMVTSSKGNVIGPIRITESQFVAPSGEVVSDYTLKDQVLIVFDWLWTIHEFGPNQIQMVGWVENPSDGWFAQLLILNRMVEEDHTS